MRNTKYSAQNFIRLLSGLLAIGLFGGYMIQSSLPTPLVITFIGLLLTAYIIGVLVYRTTEPDDRKDGISDPIFVNETWIIKR